MHGGVNRSGGPGMEAKNNCVHFKSRAARKAEGMVVEVAINEEASIEISDKAHYRDEVRRKLRTIPSAVFISSQTFSK